ncbi:MAG: UDP-N-acetylmuramoyl-L-alanyl-D-glutamate--2,6-diaminopimelate ligase [Patescibacteria group bacterium]|jgi:UDP-N-acetylmuramoyl-L-alanyl-D-glutamate--2,6-diaminopimelate ligase
MKNLIKKFIPKFIIQFYHRTLSLLGAIYYGNPSQKLIVIGVTGTNGKTTTVNFISQYLESQGQKTGLASTVNFKFDKKEWLNDKKMTMLGRFQTQKLLRDMVQAGCAYAVIETSSQGVEQFRHVNINYDLLVFTNLTPEHIEAHGGFENYRDAKEKLFAHLVHSKKKTINGRVIDKVIVSNADDQETERLKQFPADKFITYALDQTADYKPDDLNLSGGISFTLRGERINSSFIAKFNAYNILSSLTAVAQLGFPLSVLVKINLKGVPGRQEWIDEKQNYKIMVDYAPEPTSLNLLYDALKNFSRNRLIHVLGSCGGGRDKARQPILGQMAGKTADIVIVTNEDPYDDDPMEIINNVAHGAEGAGKVLNQNLFTIEDRKQAIAKALSLAGQNDLVLITGKGAEQQMVVKNGRKIPWDDRKAVRELLTKKI